VSPPSPPDRGAPGVLVVGAGPVGLAAALVLRGQDLDVTVLEADPEHRTRTGSRAIFVHRESLLLLEQASPGLGWQIASYGLVWSTKRTFWGDRQVYERTYQPPDPAVLPHSTNLPQVETERLLLDACRSAGVEIVWDSEVAAVASEPDGVRVTTRAGREWAAPYVVAADGGRSSIRRLLGISMEGGQSENSFVIVDVADVETAPRRPERVFYYRHPAVGGRNVLLVPFSGGWRADLQCRPDDDPDQFSDRQGVRQWIAQVLPAPYADRITWVSTYRFLQVVAERFADPNRRVLLVGEAAHLFAPFGARGMNSGFADATAAATAIRLAMDATDRGAATAAVDAFVATRRAAARYNRDAAQLALRHMQGRDPRVRVKRAAAAIVARTGQRAGAWLDSAPYGPRAGAGGGTSGTY
jgi:3-(3-hydroxy-phenyl)propionate hydroxylase